MADNLLVTPGTGKTMAADEVLDATLGTVSVGFGKIMDGTLDSTNKLVIGSDGAAETQGDAAHDAAVTGNPVRIGGYASAAAPSDVSADGDAVNAWMLRNGATATVLTAAGALIGGDATNGLDVDVTRSALPTGASTLAEQQTQTTALQLIDDTVVAQGTALGTTKNSLVGASVTTAAPTYTTGQINPLSLTTAGALRSDLSTIAGTAPTTAGKVDVKCADGDVFIRQSTATNLKAQAECYQGGSAVAAGNPLQVTLANTGANSTAVKVDGSAVTQPVGGVAAHGASVSGNPLLNGLEARDTLGTAVSTGQVVRAAGNRYGATVVSAIPPTRITSNVTPVTATVTTAVSAPSSGNHLRVVRFHFSNAGATACVVGIRDGAAGNVYYPTYLVQGAVITMDLNTSGVLDLTTATRMDLYLSAAGSVHYTVDYFTVAD